MADRPTDLERLRALLARQEADMGWTPGGTYDRYWKREVAETKRRIRAILKDLKDPS